MTSEARIIPIRQGTPEWHAERRTGIGSSDAPIITGDSPWGSRRRLYEEKIGEADPLPATPVMRLGSAAEPLIAELYAEQTGRAVSSEGTVVRHPDLPWMRASLDRWAGERIVECKLAGFAGVDWGEEGTDEVPAHVLVQVQHQLAVTSAPVADVAVLIPREGLRIYTVEADAALIDLLIAEEQDFFDAVMRREPPPIDGSEATKGYLTTKYPADNGAEMVADQEIAALVAAIRHADIQLDQWEMSKRESQNRIKERMGELAVCRGTGFRIDWKRTRESVKTDWESLAAGFLRQLPDDERGALVGLHSADVPGVRRFRIYETKGT